MGRYVNLEDPPFDDWNRRQRDLEGQAPIGFSSVTRGGLRIASREGLRIEGSVIGTANSELGIPAHLQWDGTATFTGNVKARKFSVADGKMHTEFDAKGVRIKNGEFQATFDSNGMSVKGTGVTGPIGGPTKKFTYESSLSHGGLRGENSLGDLFNIGPGQLGVKGIEIAQKPEGMRILVIDGSTGKVYAGPRYSANIGGGDPIPKPKPFDGTWPLAPYSYESFSLNNYDGEADYGPRSIGKGWHDGIDYSGLDATDSSPVRAIGPGVVIDPSVYVPPGDWAGVAPVIIKHDPITRGSLAGKQIFSVYAHMWTSTVSVGQRVKAGQQVGTMGNSGQSFGSHLHLEIHINSLHMYGNPGVSGSQDPVPIFNEYGGWR